MNSTTNGTEEKTPKTRVNLEEAQFAAISAYICLVGVIGFLGNSWVIAAFCRCRNLRTSTNIFIVQLAGCDLLLAFMDLAFSFPSSIKQRWLFGAVACETFGFAYHFLNAMSLNTLAVISLDRFWVITKPSFSAKITVKRAVICVSLTYFYTLIFTLPIIFRWVGFHEEMYFTGCYLNFENRDAKTLTMALTMALFLFTVPFGVMVFCYCSIFVSVRRRSRKTARNKVMARNRKLSWKFTLPHWRTARMIIVVILVFLLCWSPHVITSLCVAFGINISILVQEITLLLAKSGVIYNPFIYAVLNHRFRNAFLGMLCNKRRNYGGGECSRTPVVSGGLGSSFRISCTSAISAAKALSERLSEKEREIHCPNTQCKLKRFHFYKARMTIASFEDLHPANRRHDAEFAEVKNEHVQVTSTSSKQVHNDNEDIGDAEDRSEKNNCVNSTAKNAVKRLPSDEGNRKDLSAKEIAEIL